MRSQPSQRRLRCLSGVLLALAAACAVPSKAEAGCSHYVIAGKSSEYALTQLDLFDRDSAPTPVAVETPVPSKPCSGAFCSGKPAVPIPIPVPVTPGTTRVEQWGEVLPPPALLAVAHQFLARSERLVRPVLEGPSIDRPPRPCGVALS